MTHQTQHDIHFQVTDQQGLKTLFGDRVNDFKLLDVSKPDDGKISYIVLHEGPTPAAYAKVYSSPWNESLEVLEVHPDHRGGGFGRLVQDEVFKFAAERTGTILISPYTEDGKRHLLPARPDLEKKYPGLHVAEQQFC